MLLSKSNRAGRRRPGLAPSVVVLGVAALGAGCYVEREPAQPEVLRVDGGGGASPRDTFGQAETCAPVAMAPGRPALANAPAPTTPTPTPEPAPARASAGARAPVDTAFRKVEGEDATSTFSIDVDTASLTNVRRFLGHHFLPPADLVRLEELVNAFRWPDAPPAAGDACPLAAHVDVAGCPWAAARRLVRVALKGREVDAARRPAANLVFLVDVSGSMGSPEKLPLLQQALHLLVERLGERDRVAIVAYAGASGLVLAPTCARDAARIHAAIDGMQSGGSTNGGAGIELAYRTAVGAFVEGGINRVLLCTDGDFNVGVSSVEELERVIAAKARSGVALSVLGFGAEGGNDHLMETLADRGDGNYAAIDDLREARKVLQEQMLGTLLTIAKDVKVQVEWDPARVARYRLLGYDDRRLANQDFVNDARDAGEVGAGHCVVAFYEVEPAPGTLAGPLGALRLRWKAPEGGASQLAEWPLADGGRAFDEASAELRFGAAIVAGGSLLRGTAEPGLSWAQAIGWARAARGPDPSGERAEWIQLMEEGARLQPAQTSAASAAGAPRG